VAGPTLPDGTWLLETTIAVRESRENSVGAVSCMMESVSTSRGIPPQAHRTYVEDDVLNGDTFSLAMHTTVSDPDARGTSVYCTLTQAERTYAGFAVPVVITATRIG